MPLLMEETTDADEAPRAALPKTPVLITAATKWEANPLAKALRLTASGEGRWEGPAAGRKIVLLKTGIGAKNAADALGRGLVPADFGLAIPAGRCGAMHKDAQTGHPAPDPHD